MVNQIYFYDNNTFTVSELVDEDFEEYLFVEIYKNEFVKGTKNLEAQILPASAMDHVKIETKNSVENQIAGTSDEFPPKLIYNIWNEDDCSQQLELSDDCLQVRCKVNAYSHSVRAVKSICLTIATSKKPYIACYYEVQIQKLENDMAILIGFCEKTFPLDDSTIGFDSEHSIGIDSKGGIHINGGFFPFKNASSAEDEPLNEQDIVGIGLVGLPAMKFFASLNGIFLGYVDLPDNFANQVLFPAVCMPWGDDRICANFGQHSWFFNPYQIDL